MRKLLYIIILFSYYQLIYADALDTAIKHNQLQQQKHSIQNDLNYAKKSNNQLLANHAKQKLQQNQQQQQQLTQNSATINSH